MTPHSEIDQLRQNPEWVAVLAAYRAEQTVQKKLNPEHEGWVSRAKQVRDVENAHLSRIHGKLIAMGLLKFQLAGRTEGVVYQLSTAGRNALEQLESQPTVANDADKSAA